MVLIRLFVKATAKINDDKKPATNRALVVTYPISRFLLPRTKVGMDEFLQRTGSKRCNAKRR